MMRAENYAGADRKNSQSGPHGLDARYRFPWFGGPIYVRVILGREKRPDARSDAHIARSIRRSFMNITIFSVAACVLYTGIAAALLILNDILQ